MTGDAKRSENAWRDRGIWTRAVFSLLFLLILALLAGPLVIILGVAQGVFTILTGEDNRNLRDLGASLAEYIREALLFATWNREQKPFPFAEFPRVETAEPMEAEKAAGGDSRADGAGGERASAKKPARKSARGKSAANKAATGETPNED